MSRFAPRFLSLALVVAIAFATATPTLASSPLPATTPQATGMVDLPGAGASSVSVAVRTIVQAGTNVWIGGLFNQIDDANGNKVASASDLGVFDASTGLLVPGVHLPLVTSSKGRAEVYDSSLGPDGDLYFAGRFDAVDGQARSGAAAIDPATGALLPFAPNPGTAHAILAATGAIYVGTSKLLSFQPDGTPTPGYTPPQVSTDLNLRTEMTEPQVRDIAQRGNTLVAACQCDSLTDASGTRAVKAVVEINATTGNWRDWTPGGLSMQSPASGLGVFVRKLPATGQPTIYLAAGGNDFTAAFDFATGARVWREDTSGSSQALTWYRGYLIVGGHFDWTQQPGGPQCGTNAHPDTECYFSPRLVAMDASTGAVLLGSGGRPWNPGICCQYDGVWTLRTGDDGSTLNVGGEFIRAGGTWTCEDAEASCLSGARAQDYYARFTAPVAASRRS